MPTATATAASKTAAPKPAPVPNGDFYQLVDLLTPEIGRASCRERV